MIFDLIKNNKTLQELLIGITLFGCLCEILVLIIAKDGLHSSIGLIIGIIISLGCAIHMAYGIEIAVTLDEKSSIAITRKYTVIRYFIMCAGLLLVGVTNIGNPVTLIFGYLGLKMGAYLNPIIHKIRTKFSKGEGKE